MAAGRPPSDRRLVHLARRVVAVLGCSPAEAAALGVLVAGALAALGLLWLLARPGRPPPAGAPPDAAPGGVALQAEDIVVHVAGRVAEPGLYHLAGDARVADALAAAGGPLPDAALDALNLARPLTDGEQLLVPGPAPPPGAAAGQPAGPGSSPPGARRPDGTLDLNRATVDELEQLPGIGPVLAERIVAHREQRGGFAAVGDLREVRGIGEKTFQALAELVSV